MVVPDMRLILIQRLLEWRSQMWSPFKVLQKYYTTGLVTTHLYSV